MAADANTKPSDTNPSDSKSDASKNSTATSTTKPTAADKKASDVKPETGANAEPGRPLAPPPKPGEDYFSSQLSLEPNPFEQSFGTGGQVETPGGTKLPSVAALTSPSSLLPGGNGNTPFNWGGGSLRTGPLSPAMLSGPAGDYFGDTSHTLRGGFTPNESSLRTGLTPGGSGSMFPAPSPNSQALFASMATGGGATPGTLDFQRTALSAAAAKSNNRDQAQSQQSQPQATTATTATAPPASESTAAPVKTESKAASGSFDPHDNDAANGLFMLAQGAQQRNGSQPQFPVGGAQPGHAHPAPANAPNKSPPTATNGSAPAPAPAAPAAATGRGTSEGSSMSEEPGPAKPAAKGKGKRGAAAAPAPAPAPATNGRRKADEAPAKQPANKKAKTAAMPSFDEDEDQFSDDDDDDKGDGSGKSKMTDEEKRKNFLERNRVAALKCRQRKKQWLQNLQNKVEIYSQENDALTAQISQLREEVVSLKTLLLAHKDCPITQQQGMHGGYMQQSMDTYNPQMNPYGMAAPMANQPVMAGQGVQRRFS